MSKGKISDNNKRIGEWSYYSSNELIAKGSYDEGLKKGRWEYKDITYNSTKNIFWDILDSNGFKINIPKDWAHKINTSDNPLLLFVYESSSHANGNIILSDNQKNELDSAVKKLVLENETNADEYQLLNSKDVEINNMKGHVIKQLLNIKNKEIYIEQYVVKTNGGIYIMSFFTGRKDVSVYEQLFKEIAYSFMLH